MNENIVIACLGVLQAVLLYGAIQWRRIFVDVPSRGSERLLRRASLVLVVIIVLVATGWITGTAKQLGSATLSSVAIFAIAFGAAMAGLVLLRKLSCSR